MKWIGLFCAALMMTVAACSSELSYQEEQDMWKYAAQDAVRAQLKDGDSAEFRDVFLEQWGGGPVLCGRLNARNAFGGYAGFQRFIYRDAMPLIVDEGKAEGSFADAWWKFCGRRE